MAVPVVLVASYLDEIQPGRLEFGKLEVASPTGVEPVLPP